MPHVVRRRRAVADDGAGLGVQPLLRSRLTGQQHRRPRVVVPGRLVPGEEQRHHLVAELPVVEGLVGVCVARLEQEREQVALRLALGAPLADELEDDGVERLEGAGEARRRGGRHEGVALLVDQPERRPHRLSHEGVGARGDVS
ncbi:MAG: hypothetical protein INH37_11210 [Myxococcaceae bacterium]|nr:hypothetical protein [Myxococcaceae bacterium]